MRLLAIATLFSLVAASGSARAEEVTEPSTGHAFPASRNEGGKSYTLLGVGVRKKFVVKVYGMALYADEAEAKRAFPALAARAGGRDHDKLTASDHAQSFVAWGGFGKLGVLHFVRSVDGSKMKEAFKDGLAEELSDKAPADLKSAAEAFIALFDQEVKDGEEIVIRTGSDGRVEVSIGGQRKGGPTSPKLARAIWNVWLGPHTISNDMRKGLVDRIDLLGK